MNLPNTFQATHCHEYRVKGDLDPSYGFGTTPEKARQNAVYGADREDDSARDHYLGFGDWKMETDEKNAAWVKRVNTNSQ